MDHQAKKMKRQYRLLATPLKFILSSSLKVDKFNTMAREVLLRRMYVVTREMNVKVEHCLLRGLNSRPLVYKTSALPLS